MAKKTFAEKAKNFLGDAVGDKCFWVCDGTILKNLEELSSALKGMVNDTFTHHVNEEKNDFANWVREVIGDTTLARELAKINDKSVMLNKVKSRVQQLKKLLKTK